MAGGKEVRAGGAYVEISAKDDALGASLRRAEARVKAWADAIGKIGARVTGLGAQVLAVAAGPVALLTVAFKDLADLSFTGALHGDQEQAARGLSLAFADLM